MPLSLLPLQQALSTIVQETWSYRLRHNDFPLGPSEMCNACYTSYALLHQSKFTNYAKQLLRSPGDPASVRAEDPSSDSSSISHRIVSRVSISRRPSMFIPSLFCPAPQNRSVGESSIKTASPVSRSSLLRNPDVVNFVIRALRITSHLTAVQSARQRETSLWEYAFAPPGLLRRRM